MHDLILLGGGLANSLIALRLRARRPELRVLIVEQGAALGARHTWSFFDSDVTPEQRAWLEPLIVHRWPGHAIRFPGLSRRMATPYQSITSERLHAVVSDALPPSSVRLNAEVVRVHPDRVLLRSGETLPTRAVIDGRGPEPTAVLVLAWQKFVGRTLRLAEPHGLSEPVIMDATVPQIDGYRFVYLLPFDERRILVEDTYFSDTPTYDGVALRARLDAYALSKGWRVEAVEDEEEGVLPMALAGDIDAFWAKATVARSGLRAGLFNPLTGYSLPDAVVLADLIGATADLSGPALLELTRRHSVETWRGRAFYRLLNRFLFRAAEPAQRWRVLKRIYGLREPLVQRLYSARSTRADMARVLAGKPPVPIRRALPYLFDSSVRTET